jgi:CTP-dependent riboflavin kinase
MHSASELQSAMSERDIDIHAIADEIRRYLSAHPDAADSRDGVLRWWLTRQRIEESADAVQRALEYLVSQGKITRKVMQDGTIVYANAARKTS